MPQYKGATVQDELRPNRRRKDTRTFGQKWSDFFGSPDGLVLFTMGLPIAALAGITFPLSGELVILVMIMFYRMGLRFDKQHFNFPYRVPILANAKDGSVPGAKIGEGITYAGNEIETKEQIYLGNSDLRTHMLVLGTTGSGKTEFLLGLVANALTQNSGFIYVDGKGDPKLQKEIFRLTRMIGREDDLLIINFITSGRDFVNKQPDKVTNNMNMMGNTSSGMLIELIVALMDDSGGGGDMWKGRAISFVAALARPLVYMRDMGHINLSPDKFLDYFELSELEELVFNHNGKYGDNFDMIVAPLKSYLLTLPGYQITKKKKQETKTLEQHGFIVMQLTRIFNDLNFNYGHIFKTKVGDVDFFDVVINRRCLTVLLPALERAPDSLRMLGKMIVGSIKQMMAGCLGNRVEGTVREIIDSRPTNAKFPFYTILDEYGYYAVVGFAVAPAQARSLGFSVIFAAQDFSSLKKSSAEEADATWENTNMRAIGRITSGAESETWRRINGAAGEAVTAQLSGFTREQGELSEKFYQQDNIGIERRSRLDYDDLAMQADGEFTFIIGKKSDAGMRGGVRVIRGMGFYTASKAPKEMRINDLIPIEPPEHSELPKNVEALQHFHESLSNGSFIAACRNMRQDDPIISGLARIFDANYKLPAQKRFQRTMLVNQGIGWFLSDQPSLALLPGGIEDDLPSHVTVIDDTPEIQRTSEAAPDEVTSALSGLLNPSAPSPSEEKDTETTPAEMPISAEDAFDSPDVSVGDTVLTGNAYVPSQIDREKLASLSAVSDSILAFAALVPSQPISTSQYVQDVTQDGDDIDVEIGVVVPSTNLLKASDEPASFNELVMPLLTGLVAPDGHVVTMKDDWKEGTVATNEDFYTIEIMARPGFKSLKEKWAAEEEARGLANAAGERIACLTKYTDKPTPEPMSAAMASKTIMDLASLISPPSSTSDDVPPRSSDDDDL